MYNDAQILLGCDRADLFPEDVKYKGKVVSTGTARLKISKITGRYLAFGFNRDTPAVVTNTHTSFYSDRKIPSDDIITITDEGEFEPQTYTTELGNIFSEDEEEVLDRITARLNSIPL